MSTDTKAPPPAPVYAAGTIVCSEEQEVVPVVLKGKGGKVTEYELREMDSASIGNWMKFMQVRITGGKRKPSPEDSDYRQFQANLIHLCLFDKAGNRVPIDVIDKWFAGTLSRLFDQCEEMNGLSEAGKERAKKA